MIKNEKLGLAALLFISLLLSIYLYFKTYIISIDGAFQYIPLAKDFASGLFRKALSHNQQPLYSLMLAFVSRWVHDFETAGKVISSLFGILLIFPVYFLGKRIFDEKVAFFSAFLLILHPYIRQFSADVLKESTYLFFYASALWFAWRAIQDGKRMPFIFVSLFSVLAYMVRPDGVEVLLVVFFYILFVKHFSIPRDKKKILLLLFPLIILLIPYLIYLREVRGEWTFGKAKSVVEMLGFGVGGNIPFIQKILYSLKSLNLNIYPIFHPVYVFLLIVGLAGRCFHRPKAGEGFLLCSFGLHYAVLFLMVLNTTQWGENRAVLTDYLSGRHVLPLLLVSIYWMGDGFMMIYHAVSGKLESHLRRIPLAPIKRSALILVMLCFLVSALVLPKTLKAQRYQRLPEKWAGMWIKHQYGKGTNIFTTLPQVVYYAEGEGEWADLQKGELDRIKDSMLKKKALLLVVREEERVYFAENAGVTQKNFVETARFGGNRMEEVIVYKMIR